jgi:hypothetical protein
MLDFKTVSGTGQNGLPRDCTKTEILSSIEPQDNYFSSA